MCEYVLCSLIVDKIFEFEVILGDIGISYIIKLLSFIEEVNRNYE